MPVNTLDEIAIFNGTDKATIHPVKGHGYTPFYDQHFFSLRRAPIKLLEIGVGSGESIRTWLDYFWEAKIFGVDIVHETNEWNEPGTEGRYTFVYGDQTDPTFWRCFIADYGKDWDIIIDDGGHFNDGIVTTYRELWPHVRNGGLYCVEDIGAGYTPGSVFIKPGFPTHAEWLGQLLYALHTGASEAQSMFFASELLILKKAG